MSRPRENRKLFQRVLLHETFEPRLMFNADWQNPLFSLDTNTDGFVSPIDALVVINTINQNGSRSLQGSPATEDFLYDTSGDNFVTPIDVLLVINHLNREGSGPVVGVLAESRTEFHAEQLFSISTGAGEGSRKLLVELESYFPQSKLDLATEDLLCVYIVDATRDTLLDRAETGTSVFTLSAHGAETVSDISTWDGNTLTLDISLLGNRSDAKLLVQLLNGDGKQRTMVRVNSLQYEADPLGAVIELSEDLLPLRMFEGPEVDTSALMPTANLHLDVSNVRYDSDSGEYAADLRVQNFGEAIGRQAVVELAGLPNDATVWNASGISTSGLPYINFSTAIFSGGLGEFDQSYIVPLAISNPSKVPLVITPRALVGGPNMAPTLAPIPTVNVVPGQKVSVVLGGADADGDMLTYTLSDLNSGPTSVLQGNILTIAPAPEEIGTYDMDVIVSDGMLVARQPIKINVNDDSNTNTRITGQVLDVDGTPLVGVQVEIGSIQALTRSDGKFEVDLGTSSLVTDTIKIRGELIAGTFTYPFIAEKLPLLMGHDVYEGYNNFIDRPIFLPKLDTANAKVINPSQTTVVTTTAIPEAKVTVAAGTLMNQQGAPFTGSLSITEVPLERTPAAVPDGLFPDLVVTIQPGEMVFTTPTPLSLPNRAGRLPGTVLDLWSINPTTGQFEIVGQGEVSADGLRIDTISGGIRNSSWHLFQDPDPPDPKDPQNPPQGCRSCEKKGPFNSTVSFQSGAVTETHSLPSYQSLGEAHNVTLYYDSDRADPRPILRVGFDNTANTFGVDLQLSGRVSLTTGRTTVFSQGLEEGTYPFFAGESVWTLPQGQDSARGAVQLDLSGVSTGIYSYVSISRLHAPRGVVASAVSSQPYVHVNTTNSVFGSGWGIGGLKELVVKQGTTCGSGRGSVCFSFPEELVIVDGNGSETRFGGGTLGTTIFESLAGDFSTISFDSANKTFTHRMLDGTTYSYEPVFLPSGQANPSFQLTSVSDRNGNVTTYKYENGIGITSIVDPVGLTTHFEYSGSRVARIIDPAGRVTTLSYDNDGNLISVSDPDSSQRQWQYDSRSHMVGEITKRGFTQEAKYDSTGRVYEATREDGSVVKVTALANQGVYPVEMTTDVTNPPIAQGSVSVASYTDASGNVTRYTIDGRGQSLGARDVFGQTTRSTRDDLNQVVSTTDARLNQTSYNYDDHGNVIEITDTFSEEAQFSPTITWTGAVSEDWSDPGNWDLNRIPSPEDDVLINSSQFTVNLSGHFLGAEIAVRSLQSYASLAANNVTLVLSGQSHLYRGCQLNSAGIYANGPGAIVILDGTTSLEGSTIRATNGGSIKVAQLHSTDNALSALSNVSASGNDSQILFQQTEFASSARLLRFAVEGQNSEIRFEKLAVLIGDNPGANGIRWEATGGGVIAAPLLASATGLTALVDGAFSRIEFSTLTSLDGATIYVYSGGTIDSPRLMSLTRSFLRVRGTGNFPVGQLTNVDGSGISAGEGAKLVVNVATYDLRNSQEVEFNAFALGSEISFPNLTAITDNNLSTQVVRWRVSDGGLLVAPLLTQANRFTASVFDSGSRIELNTIATFDEASIFVYDGELFSPALHSLVASGLTIQGAGKFPLDQLTNLNNSVIEARAGAKLVINSESFGLSQPGFWATGVGAEIRFPNLTAIIDDSSVSNRARWQADSGGLLSAPKLMTLTGFTALVFGDSSRVEFDAIETVNNSQLSVEGDSELFAPHLQILTSTNLLVSGTGTFPISQLSNIDRCEIRASGGAKLVFGVESYELTNVYPYAFSASGNGTEIHFPNLTTITESGSGNAGYLDARGGGLLSVPALRVAARFFA
ncbi:MAG: hypothetical protein KDB22_18255, partial [Planctomycetales bacterium]|nr:hypothetical protein [Planctomycetales bacterium]